MEQNLKEIKEDLQLVKEIIKLGSNESEARRIIDIVNEAKRNMRAFALERYVGKRMRAEFSGLLFEVIIKDIKIDNQGKILWLVSPLNGTKTAWVEKVC